MAIGASSLDSKTIIFTDLQTASEQVSSGDSLLVRAEHADLLVTTFFSNAQKQMPENVDVSCWKTPTIDLLDSKINAKWQCEHLSCLNLLNNAEKQFLDQNNGFHLNQPVIDNFLQIFTEEEGGEDSMDCIGQQGDRFLERLLRQSGLVDDSSESDGSLIAIINKFKEQPRDTNTSAGYIDECLDQALETIVKTAFAHRGKTCYVVLDRDKAVDMLILSRKAYQDDFARLNSQVTWKML